MLERNSKTQLLKFDSNDQCSIEPERSLNRNREAAQRGRERRTIFKTNKEILKNTMPEFKYTMGNVSSIIKAAVDGS